MSHEPAQKAAHSAAEAPGNAVRPPSPADEDPLPGAEAARAKGRSGCRGLFSSLGIRLAAMVLIALLPLGLMVLAQSILVWRHADEIRFAASIGRTWQAAQPEIRAIRSAQVSARLLASGLSAEMAGGLDPSSPMDQPVCTALAASFASAENRIRRAAYVARDGMLRCSSDGSEADLAADPRLAELLASEEPTLFSDAAWAPTGTRMISLSAPVRAPTGEIAGFVLLSLPQAALLAARAEMPAGPETEPPLALLAANSKGEILYATGGLAAALAFLPVGFNLRALAAPEAQSFKAQSAAGGERIFSTLPIGPDLYLLGIWPLKAEEGLFWRALTWLIPALIWLAGVVATLLGVRWLVTRHVRRLSVAMRDFSGGRRHLPDLALKGAPAEITALADSFTAMTSTILHDEAELEDLLRQKATLLREVHHRTGNSLQLIASFLRMHRRETEDEAIRNVLDDLHNRVMSLSSVHLGLYRMAGDAVVEVDQLVAEVIAKVEILHGRGRGKGAIEPLLQRLLLSPQQAVPLALLLAEILSCFPPGEAETPPIRIRLSADAAGLAELRVSGPLAARGRLAGTNQGAPSVIGARLMRGFVTQLNGQMAITEDETSVIATITFPVAHPVAHPNHAPPGL